MRLSSIALAGAIALSPVYVNAEPATYEIDPAHFSIGFSSTHIGFAPVLGMFLEGGGSFVFDEETRELSNVDVTIKAASVFTNHEKRDGHARSKDFLFVEDFPEIRFVMTSAEATSDTTGTVTGDLTLRGVTKPVTLDVTWNKSGEYPFGNNYAIGISASTVVKRSEFGMTYAVENGWVGDETPITIELEAIRQ